MEMKVSMKKGVGFYIRAAASFLKGVEAREAAEGKEAVEAKAPVEELKISGLGEAINTAVTAATRAEADGLGTITKVETAYPDMSNGRGCAQIFITLKRKA
uniref:DNA/RNA-binding protein Alba-like domain-containing protein n=1 Tax=Alexandrium catenella TaxID=2925 RepID=A0A6T9GQY7_ALECA